MTSWRSVLIEPSKEPASPPTWKILPILDPIPKFFSIFVNGFLAVYSELKPTLFLLERSLLVFMLSNILAPLRRLLYMLQTLTTC